MRRSGQLGFNLAADFLLMTGAGQAALYTTGLTVGLSATGALRGAQVLFGPVMVAITGFRVFALPEGVRMRDDRDNLERRAIQAAVGLASLATAATVAALALPDRIGLQLMGSSWHGVEGLLLLTGLSIVGRAITASPLFGLRVLGDGRRTLLARRIDAPMTLIFGAGGAWLFGAQGAAGGAALANGLATIVWWRAFLASTRGTDKQATILDAQPDNLRASPTRHRRTGEIST
jgi:O-antigen/teichoic acid export membrane protein